MKNLVLIGSRKLGTSVDIVNRALGRGLVVSVVVDPNEDFCDVFPSSVEVVPLRPDLAVIATWFECRFHNCINETMVVSAYSPYVVIAAKIAEIFRRPGPDARAIQSVETKASQRRLLANVGLNTVRHVHLDTCDRAQVSEKLASLSYPVVIKPDQGTGARGVFKCESLDDVKDYLQAHTEGAGTVVEQFVDGEEFCVELFNGVFVGVLRKIREADGKFLERGYSSDLNLKVDEIERLAGAAERLCNSAEIAWGPVHLDVIWSGGEPFIVDINSRIAGSFITEMVSDSFAVDIVGMLLDMASGSVPSVRRGIKPVRYCRMDFVLESAGNSFGEILPDSLECDQVAIKFGPMHVPLRGRIGYTYFRQR